MARTNADDDLKSKSLQAEFGEKRSFGRGFCITVKRLQHIKKLLTLCFIEGMKLHMEKFNDGIVLR